jgi:flagellar hook-basal body complex protein FliE
MTISPISLGPVLPVQVPAAPEVGASGATTGAGESFAAALGRGLEHLAQTQATAETLAVQAATGELTDVHDYTIAATQAQLATELTVAVRNKAVEAFSEIMRMQV